MSLGQSGERVRGADLGGGESDGPMTCRLCGQPRVMERPGGATDCERCGRWPLPVIEAQLEARDESRERVKVRLIATGNNQYEFRACRIDGEWVAVEDTRDDRTFWVARHHIVTVWEERV